MDEDIEVWTSALFKKVVRNTLRWRAPKGDVVLALDLTEVFEGLD